MATFDLINIALAIVGTTTLAFGFIVYLTEVFNRKNIVFFLFVFAIFGWILTMFMFRAAEETTASLFWAHLLYASAAAIPYPFIFLSYIFLDEKYKFSAKFKTLLFIPFLFIVIISIFPNFLIKEIIITPPGEEKIIIFNDFLHFIYGIYINVYFLWVYVNFIRIFKRTRGLERKQITYVFIGTLASTLIGVTTNLTLPLQGNFDYNWLGQVTIIIMVVVIFYAMIRHSLFNVKIITTEIFVFSLWGFVLARALLQEDRQDVLLDAGLFFVTIVVGVLLIRSVIKEVQSKDFLEKAHIQLQELDKQKSDFISIASHQLRTPMTIIKGYISMILEGSFGKIPKQELEPLQNVYASNNRLIGLIEMLLNISRIESGKLKYEFNKMDLTLVVDSVIDELQKNAKEKGLELVWERPKNMPKLILDEIKIRQVVFNLIDNAVKYTQEGSVKVALKKKEDTVMFSCTDTGIGMSKEEQYGLFNKFSRVSDKASKANTGGSGLGLYVGRMMIEVHGGTIWAKSAGAGKGSTFGFNIPIDQGKLPKQSKESRIMNREQGVKVKKKK